VNESARAPDELGSPPGFMTEHQNRRLGALVAAGLALTAFLVFIRYSQSGADVAPASRDVQLRPQSFQGRALASAQFWQLAGNFHKPDDTAPEMDWEESRAWLRGQIEAIAAADNRTGWHGTADPPGVLGTLFARRRQLLSSLRRGRGLSAADGAANSTGVASSAAASQQPEQQQQQQQQQAAEASADEPPDDAGGTPTRQTALLAVPTANVWARTELLIASLAAVKDKFELLVGAGRPQRSTKAGTANQHLARRHSPVAPHASLLGIASGTSKPCCGEPKIVT